MNYANQNVEGGTVNDSPLPIFAYVPVVNCEVNIDCPFGTVPKGAHHIMVPFRAKFAHVAKSDCCSSRRSYTLSKECAEDDVNILNFAGRSAQDHHIGHQLGEHRAPKSPLATVNVA